MNVLEEIRTPIKQHLVDFEDYFKSTVKTKIPLLNTITQYIIKSKGKQMRPMFVLLSAALLGDINKKTYRAAALIELLHTATLVHDDVVDESDKRRGLFSVNALWKNKAAVLVGDFLLSRGMLLSLENKDFDMLEIASNAIKKMSEGELLQIEKTRRLNIDEDIYFEIIRCKTASLFAACCACGASSVLASKEDIEKMALFGETIGIAFQIKDDLFDFEQINNTGKPNRKDVKDKKLTLPLIYLINNASYLDKRKYVNIIKNKTENAVELKFIIDKVYESGGIAYAENKMQEYYLKAMHILNTYTNKPAKESLQKLLKYTIERTK